MQDVCAGLEGVVCAFDQREHAWRDVSEEQGGSEVALIFSFSHLLLCFAFLFFLPGFVFQPSRIDEQNSLYSI